MVKTLRITSYLLAAGAICGGAVLLLLGLRGNAEIQAFLDREGVVSGLKHQSQTPSQQDDTVSPLVVQAQKFALRIDPPPPPQPVTQRTETIRPVTPVVAPPVVTPPVSSGQYRLLATARAEAFPERSLALFQPTSGSSKWHRQGETLGYLEIHEILDGSVVLFQQGKKHSELFVPKPAPQSKPLLKSEAEAIGWTESTVPTRGANWGSGSGTSVPVQSPSVSGGGIRIPRSTTRTAPQISQTPLQTPEQQKESLTQNISNIEEIMKQGTSEGLSPQEQQEEQEAWMKLLTILKQEQQALGGSEKATEETESAPQTSQGEAQNSDPNKVPPRPRSR